MRKRGSHKEIKSYFLYMKCSLTDYIYLTIEIMQLRLGDEQFCCNLIHPEWINLQILARWLSVVLKIELSENANVITIMCVCSTVYLVFLREHFSLNVDSQNNMKTTMCIDNMIHFWG